VVSSAPGTPAEEIAEHGHRDGLRGATGACIGFAGGGDESDGTRQVGGGIGRGDVFNKPRDGREVGGRGHDHSLGGPRKRDQRDPVRRAERAEHLVGGGLVARERRTGAGRFGIGDRRGEGVVDHQDNGPPPGEPAEQPRAGQQRPGDREPEQQHHEAAERQQDELFELQASALFLVRLDEEPHRGPDDGLAPLPEQQVDDDRDGDGKHRSDGKPGVEETHPILLRLNAAFRRAMNAAMGGPSQSCVTTRW